MDLLQLAESYGTPLYVYDSAIIIRNYERFRRAFDVPQLDIHYAAKALGNISILRLMKSIGARLDCVSVQEVRLGLMAGFAPGEIIYTPNSVSEAEYEAAIGLGVGINVDSLQMLEYMGVNHPRQPLCLRINPHLMAGGNKKISVGHIDSKFGISIHQMPLARRIIRNFGIPIRGLHVHTGSDIIDPEIFIRASELIFAEAMNFEELDYIDFGSGFKVKYRDSDLSTDIEELGRSFSREFNEFCVEYGRELALKFEPGKYLVSESGSFLARVNLIKQTTACTFAGLDTGFNHLIRPMFYDAWHEITNLSNPDGERKLYTIVGYLCETDTFGADRVVGEIRKGDVLRFANAGAYCYAMSSNYNSRFRPAEVLIHNGRDYLIRRRETLDDLVRTQPDPAL
ncbi:MAG: diaminopimelate decarboxylase [Candidatus Kapaibacterium sp.]